MSHLRKRRYVCLSCLSVRVFETERRGEGGGGEQRFVVFFKSFLLITDGFCDAVFFFFCSVSNVCEVVNDMFTMMTGRNSVVMAFDILLGVCVF